jgi:hypothetical protein
MGWHLQGHANHACSAFFSHIFSCSVCRLLAGQAFSGVPELDIHFPTKEAHIKYNFWKNLDTKIVMRIK